MIELPAGSEVRNVIFALADVAEFEIPANSNTGL